MFYVTSYRNGGSGKVSGGRAYTCSNYEHKQIISTNFNTY